MAEKIINNEVKLWRKWFWVGIAIGILSMFTGILPAFIFGIALAFEKGRRKEGLVILLVTVIWFAAMNYLVFPQLMKAGYMSKYQVTQVNDLHLNDNK